MPCMRLLVKVLFGVSFGIIHEDWHRHPFQNDLIPKQTGSFRGTIFASYRSRMCRPFVSEAHCANFANPKRSPFPIQKLSLNCGVFSSRELLPCNDPSLSIMCFFFILSLKESYSVFAPDLSFETS